MLNRLIAYSAVSAKVRALWGRRLTGSDYGHMAAMRSVAELAHYIHSLPRWGGALTGLDFQSVSRAALEERLRRHRAEEILRLYPYLNPADKDLISFPVLDVELHQIMRWLRLAGAGRQAEYSYTPPPQLKKFMNINYPALSNAKTYADLIACAGIDYAHVLAKLAPEGGGFPQFTLVETALLGHYLHSMHNLVLRRKSGSERESLLVSIGMRGDLFNISVISRVLRYHPSMTGSILSFLVPVSAYLRPGFLKDLCSAKNHDEFMVLLRRSRYKRWLPPDDPTPDRLSVNTRHEFYRRHLHSAVPSEMTPLSYLYLSELELENIIHIVECVRYGVEPAVTMTYVTYRD
ncbi:MAG: V-type ATPase subunit [Oscillospiraceae bacterium]|jgi:vacuolar-type H+-ATPase subunit C/Vma6|nr:V-type ATPase subunit [Oscillospiraceae bacterium]